MRATLIILGLTAALGPLASHTVVALLPTLQAALGVSYAAVQLIVSIYLIAIALGQLLLGPVSDRFGRERVLIFGLVLFVASSAAICFSAHIGTIVALRFLQGASASAGMVIALAAIASHAPERTAPRAGYLMAWLSIVGTAAPFVGGIVGARYGWQATFALNAAVGLACLVLVLLRRKGSEPAPDPSGRDGASGYLRSVSTVVRNPGFAAHAGIIGLGLGGYFFTFATLPYTAQYTLGLSPVANGAWLILPGMTMPFAALLAGWLAPRFGVRASMLAGSAMMIVSALLPSFLLSLGVLSPVSLFGPMSMLAFSMTMVVALAQAQAVASSPRLAGTASGLCGAAQFGAAALFSLLGGWAIERLSAPVFSFFVPAAAALAIAFVAWKTAARGEARAA